MIVKRKWKFPKDKSLRLSELGMAARAVILAIPKAAGPSFLVQGQSKQQSDTPS